MKISVYSLARLVRALVSVVSIALLIAGCAPAATATPIPPVTLDTAPSEITSVKASAEVAPVQEARLSFLIPGPVEEVTIAEGDMVEAGQTLAILSSPDLEYGLLQAEAALRSAEFDYAYWAFPRTNRPPERRELAEQQLITVQRSLATARAEFMQTTLVAPFAATVISVEVQPGEYVNPGQVVIWLAKLDELQIETTDLSELNVAAVEIGQPATVYVEALNQEFEGEVTAIAPISGTIGGDVVFKVTIQLDEQPDALLWGMSADVEINVE
jgi:multidrug efflux pump subunit AcrA (membrane-fusion protein)